MINVFTYEIHLTMVNQKITVITDQVRTLLLLFMLFKYFIDFKLNLFIYSYFIKDALNIEVVYSFIFSDNISIYTQYTSLRSLH